MTNISIKRFNLPGTIKYYGTDIDVLIPEVYVEKSKELRGVWFSTVGNIDIPKMENVTDESIQKMKDYLLSVLQTVKEYNMNTVIFQVRPVNDALYQSDLNPWSQFLTGQEGLYPGFDVFGFFVQEAKKQNVKVHAWINPYRAGREKIDELNITKEEYLNGLSENNFARLNPDCVILTKDKKILLDPASAKVREFVSDSVLEIARKYDIKAVHIDDYFYPYEDINDPDEEEKVKQSSFSSRNDFRRGNVDLLIELISKKLKTLSKKVEFGISPFGIYRTLKRNFTTEDEAAWEYGSNNHSDCMTCYKGLFADVYKWMEKGWIDYVVPQDYFDMDSIKIDDEGKEKCLVKYADLANWWSWAAEKTNVKLYMGQAFYRYSKEGAWSNPEEITNQLRYNQTLENVIGTVFFTYKDFKREDCVSVIEGKKLLKKLWTKEVSDI